MAPSPSPVRGDRKDTTSDEDDYVNDYIGGVLEDDEFKEDAYFEIYDEDGNLVDSGNPNSVS